MFSKKNITIFFILFSNITFGQSIMISLEGNDCVKCKISIDTTLAQLKHIPTFYIFAKSYEKDSVEIRNQFLSKGDYMVFNDELYNEKKIKGSAVVYFDHKGQKKYEKSIGFINTSDAKTLAELYDRDFLYSVPPSNLIFYKDGWRVDKNFLLNYLDADSASYSVKFRLFQENVELDSMMSEIFPDLMAYRKQMIAKFGINNFMPQVSANYFEKGVLYSIIKYPYVERPTISSINAGYNDGELTNKLILSVLDAKGQKSFFILPEGINNSWALAEHTLFVNNNKLYFLYISSIGLDKGLKFIAQCILTKDGVQFQKVLNNIYDEKIVPKGQWFSVLPSLNAIDYPFYIPNISTRIVNQETEQDYDISNLISQEWDNADLSNISINNPNAIPISNISLLLNNNKNKLYLVSKLKGSYYLSKFHINESGKPIFVKSYSFNQLGIKLGSLVKFSFEKSNNSFTYIDIGRKVRTCDLRIFD